MIYIYIYSITTGVLVFVLRLIRGANVFVALIIALVVGTGLFFLGKVIFEYLRAVLLTNEEIDIKKSEQRGEHSTKFGAFSEGVRSVFDDAKEPGEENETLQSDEDDENGSTDDDVGVYSKGKISKIHQTYQAHTGIDKKKVNTHNLKNDTINYVEDKEAEWAKNIAQKNKRHSDVSTRLDTEEIIEKATRNPEAVKYAIRKWSGGS